MFTFLIGVFGLLPSVVLLVAALLVWRFAGGRAPAFQIGLWAATLGSAGYVIWQLGLVHAASRRPGFTTSGLILVALPLMAAGVAIVALAYAWGLATLGIEAHRLARGATTAAGAAARAVLPAVLVAVVSVTIYLQTRPTAHEEVGATTSPDDFARLYERAARSRDLDLLQSLANSRAIPARLLGQLAADPHPWVRARAAANDRTPPDDLDRLARDADADVRLAVARNRAAPTEVLRRLAAGGGPAGDEAARQWATRHPSSAPSATTAPAPASGPATPAARPPARADGPRTIGDTTGPTAPPP